MKLKKEPDYLLLHVGTNNCTFDPPKKVMENMLLLKEHIESVLPKCKVILSQPIIRTDSQKAAGTMRLLISLFNNYNLYTMDNSNIGVGQLGKKGLHLNDHGTKMLAMNIISLIRSV